MKTISSLEELSVDELIKIRDQLIQRFGIGKRGNIIEVAFGLAEHNQRLDRSRPNAICFYVRHKRLPRAKVDRIPERIELRLKRGRRFVQVSLATDVIHLGTRQVRPTGERLVHDRSKGPVTTGAVVAWRLKDQAELTWGLITVGHVLSRIKMVPEREARVWIGGGSWGDSGGGDSGGDRPIRGVLLARSDSWGDRRSDSQVRGVLLARSKPRNPAQVDAAIVEVDRASLVRANLIPANGSTAGKRIRPVPVLKNDRGKSGFTFPEQVMLRIRVLRFLPLSEMVPALGTLRDVLEADAAPGVFGMGRSGSLWAVERQAAGMQHGGLPNQFARGWGQALETVLGWCVRELAAIHQMPAEDVELKLIRVI